MKKFIRHLPGIALGLFVYLVLEHFNNGFTGIDYIFIGILISILSILKKVRKLKEEISDKFD